MKLTYRQWQQRNTEAFSKKPKSEQKALRQKGYNNRGWSNVRASWDILHSTLKSAGLDDLEVRRELNKTKKEIEGMNAAEALDYLITKNDQILDDFTAKFAGFQP